MEIISCLDAEYTEDPALLPLIVAINPETINVATNIVYKANGAPGSTGADMTFEKIQPQDMKFELLFDSTGVLSNQKEFLSGFKAAGEVQSVFDQVEEFRNVAFGFDPKSHKPRHLKLCWGEFLFKGVVKSWSITYTLFHPDGTPLRAKGTLSIVESIADALRLREEDKSSPDLTHLRVVKAGDTLPNMCQTIYGNSSYYVNVAEFNKLNSFRKLKPGTKLFFPPLVDATNS